jgi:hypothetical protein
MWEAMSHAHPHPTRLAPDTPSRTVTPCERFDGATVGPQIPSSTAQLCCLRNPSDITL